MAIQFCDDCGDTLPISVQKLVTCGCCGKENRSMFNRWTQTGFRKKKCSTNPAFLSFFLDTTLRDITNQKSNNFPSPLRAKLRHNIQQLSSQDRLNSRVIQRECPKCHAPEVTYIELQLRGADEGSTIIYTCPRCLEKYIISAPFPLPRQLLTATIDFKRITR